MARGKPEKYFELAELVRRFIRDGNLKRHDALPPERQMAASFGVNQLTLRKALRLLEQERLIYKEPSRGNYVGPKPPSGKGRSFIGFLVPDNEIFYHAVITSLEERFDSAGLHPVLSFSHNSARKEESMLSFADSQELGALVAVPNPDCAESYRKLQTPLVFFDAFINGFEAPHVISDDRQGAIMAAKHLLSLGHKRIAYIGSPYDRAMILRFEGLSAALGEIPERYVKSKEATRIWGYKAAGELLSHSEPPTAILCGNDTIAAGACRYCAEHGVSIPSQCSVAGFGNTDVAEDIALTSVDQQVSLIASSLWNILCMAMKGDKAPLETVIPTNLVVRGSTGRPLK